MGLTMIDIKKVGIVGAGTMGAGIAQLVAQSEFEPILMDLEEEIIKEAMDQIRSNLDNAVEKNIFSDQEVDEIYSRIEAVKELEKVTDEADIIIECVPEKVDLKKDIFEKMDRKTEGDVILATNTSSISVAEIGSKTEDKGRVIGLHFFNPPYIMELLEVITTRNTSEEVKKKTVEFGKELGRDPVVINDSPGFVSARIGMALGFEAARVVQEGIASPEAVDKIMEKGYNHKMGPLRTGDLVGWDVKFHIGEYLYEEFGDPLFKPPLIIRNMVRAGELGKKSGKGFYEWDDASGE